MKFTLRYSGDLPSAGNGSKRVREKWAIRRYLHPQLVELWATVPALKRLSQHRIFGKTNDLYRFEHHAKNVDLIDQIRPPNDLRPHRDIPLDSEWQVDLCKPVTLEGKTFFPLATKALDVSCELSILFLRKEEPGSIIKHGGDLDNRIKTLFDGLRLPSRDEIHAADPLDDYPMYCLLEEDSLISGLSIKTDRLLSRPNQSKSEVDLVIEVTLKVTQAGLYNFALMS